MKATLTSKLTVHAITLFAEMAWLEHRPELGVLCKAARDSNNRLTDNIIQQTLPGISNAGAHNIIDHCKLLGLTESNGHLTELGQTVADTNLAPVPEQGVYNLWITEHPMLNGTTILAAERHAPKQNATNMTSTQLVPLPLQPPMNRAFQSLTNPQEEFLIRTLPHQHNQPECVIASKDRSAQITWIIDFDNTSSQWKLHGNLTPINSKVAQTIQDTNRTEPVDHWSFMDDWAQNPAIQDIGKWNAQKQYLAVTYNQLTPEEQLSFTTSKDVVCSNVTVPNKGDFNQLVLKSIPLGPSSQPQANEWANGILLHKLTQKPEFRTRQNLKQLFDDSIESTPLAEYSPTFPAHKDLLKELDHQQKTPEAFWSIAAPVDLAFIPVTEEELAEQTFLTPTPTMQTASKPNQFIVPHNADWSMQQLVSRLFQGTTPQRILLCDPYVADPKNHKTLKLLVDTIKEHAPTTQLEVWTRPKDNDLYKITAITGNHPLEYKDIFGKAHAQHPHDRYILIKPEVGEGFIWNLSNSPLHAKVPASTTPTTETPLQWKDLVANKFDADQFGPQMTQWLKGA